MSRFKLPQSTEDWIAAVVNVVTVVALVWLIVVAAPEVHGVPAATTSTVNTSGVNEHGRAPAPVASDYLPAQLKAPEDAPAEPIATF
jgi:hypothetical protein